MNPFRISCTTCRARLKITDPVAIGQILACPKCGGMVQATPPADWSPGELVTGSALPTGATAALAESASVVLKPKVVRKLAAGAAQTKATKTGTAAAANAIAAATGPLAASLPPVQPMVPPVNAATAPSPLPAAEPTARWFWPAFGVGTLMSVALVGLLLWLDHKNHSSPIAALDVNAKQDASAVPSATDSVKSTAIDPKTQMSPAAASPPSHPSDSAANIRSAAKSIGPAPSASSHVAADDRPDPRPTAPPSGAAPESIAKPADLSSAVPPAFAPAAAADAKPRDPLFVEPAPDKRPAVEPDIANSGSPAARPVPSSVERIPPRTVDVASRLTDPLAAVNYVGVPLAQLLGELSQWSTISISFDADALSELNVAPDVPVTLHLKETTIAGVLDEALGPLGLSYSIVNGQLMIGRPRQGDFRRVRYAVSDLAGETADGAPQFAALVHAMVDPPSWKEAGGMGTSRWSDGALVIEQSESAHAQLLVFCEKLRVARGLPLRSKIDPDRFRLMPRTAAAARALALPVTADFNRPEPLTRILAHLHDSTHIALLVDQVALAEQRMSAETEGILAADHQPLGQALTALVEPMDLAWRVVGEGAIEITTPQAAAKRADVEFYLAGELLSGDTNGQALVDRIERELAAAAASDPAAARPTVRFDAASRALIVRAPQSVQLRVAAYLSGRRIAARQ
ncbi:MAG TPA: hypothetical protein VG056_02050 [Pirellulales bacterium]|nr:hypothetical protein [Pirellulales bacterium]